MKIVKYPNKILTTPTTEIKEITPELIAMGILMLKAMEEGDGVGLAANQVGLSHRMFVSSVLPHKMIINPVWQPTVSGFQYPVIEGCLSFPGWIVPVKRYDCIVAEWTDIAGTRHKKILKEFAAQVFQHETEHLEGLTMLEHLTESQQRTLRNFYRSE